MNKTLFTILAVFGVVVVAVLLLSVGVFAGRATASSVFPGGMMGFFNSNDGECAGQQFGMGPGMMGGWQQNNNGSLQTDCPYGMDSGMMGGGMMGGFGSSGLRDVEPLSIEQAQQAVEGYLADYGNRDLALKEIMIFDHHAYAEIVETSTGIGAMEVLVDPISLSVYPEHGPNMMWNLKYGMMAGNNRHGMMGRFWNWNQPGQPDISSEMTISPESALEKAQEYLDASLAGTQVGEHADPFYGYYTLHIERDGSTIGMLSVNGYNGQVFLHTWHGDFIEMVDLIEE